MYFLKTPGNQGLQRIGKITRYAIEINNPTLKRVIHRFLFSSKTKMT